MEVGDPRVTGYRVEIEDREGADRYPGIEGVNQPVFGQREGAEGAISGRFFFGAVRLTCIGPYRPPSIPGRPKFSPSPRRAPDINPRSTLSTVIHRRI